MLKYQSKISNWIVPTKLHVKSIENSSCSCYRFVCCVLFSASNEKSIWLLFGLPNFRIYSSIQISCMNTFDNRTCKWKITENNGESVWMKWICWSVISSIWVRSNEIICSKCKGSIPHMHTQREIWPNWVNSTYIDYCVYWQCEVDSKWISAVNGKCFSFFFAKEESKHRFCLWSKLTQVLEENRLRKKIFKHWRINIRWILLTDLCILCNGGHVMVAFEFWRMIIYVTNSDIYIANGNKSTIVRLMINMKKPNENTPTPEKKHKK